MDAITAVGNKRSKFSLPLLRQVCTGIWMTYFCYGLSLGAPTVYIPQIRKEANSTDVISDDMASWLSAITGYAGLPWVLILPIFSHIVGRKIPFMILSVISFSSFALLYFSTNYYHLLTSGILQGIVLTYHHTITPIIVTEYTAPTNRGMFLTIKSASVFWGIWVSNAIGTFYNWRNIGICGMICSLYTITSISWLESPYWLAAKGRYEECCTVFRKLRGIDAQAEEELKNLINYQKHLKNNDLNVTAAGFTSKKMVNMVTSREFYMPVTICMFMLTLYHASGKLACTLYAIDIIKKITDNESTAYKGMLILDGVTVLGMYFGCLLSKFIKRRTLLLIPSVLAVLSLFGTSLYLYLIKLNIVIENSILSILLLMCFFLTISCGPIILATSLYGELISSKYKTPSILIIGLFGNTILSSVIKFSPYIFKTFGLHGAFLFYGISSSVCIIFLLKYLPETKDKSLIEIEENFKRPSKLRKEEERLVI